jgi:protein AaeX
MTAEFDFYGVYVGSALISACMASLPFLLARWLMQIADLYRYFWHPALLNISLFVIFWSASGKALSLLTG